MQKNKHSEAILNFYLQLKVNIPPGNGIAVLNPFEFADTFEIAETFYNKFYNDTGPRKLMFGINPGRFGGGITGIPFTDPVRLKQDCGIDNDLAPKPELSSVFIYKVIEAWGGAEKFYNDIFITALSPLGFTKNGLNLNYYDDKELLKTSENFIVECIQKQAAIFNNPSECYCIGEGTNYKIFSKLNEKHRFFKEIIPLPHPRWIMQYRRKKVDEFVQLYISKLNNN